MACLSRSDEDLFSGNKLKSRKNFASNDLVRNDRGTDEINIKCEGPDQIYSLNDVCRIYDHRMLGEA